LQRSILLCLKFPSAVEEMKRTSNKERNKTAAKFINVTAQNAQKTRVSKKLRIFFPVFFRTISCGCIYSPKVALTFSNQLAAPSSLGLY
jgi:hypothetical protein